jgi:hypothetical protein
MDTQYTDFRISASEIGSLLGLLGGNKQFHSVCKVWEKSTYKSSYQGVKSGYTHWQEENQHLRLLGVTHIWQQICSNTGSCVTQDDVLRIHTVTFQLLFQNDCINNAIKKARETQSKDLQQLLHDIQYNQETSYECLQILHAKRTELGLDSLHTILKLLDMSSKLCYTIQQRCARAYGINGERQFVMQFANCWEESRFEQKNKMLSKTVAGEEVDGSSWCIDGRIDGLQDGEIVEIKHRKRGFFKIVPLYELMQLHAYMFLLGKNEATLIQCIRKENYTGSHANVIYFSSSFWHSTVLQLKKCLLFIKMLHSQPLTQDCFLALDDSNRNKVMDKYISHKEFL